MVYLFLVSIIWGFSFGLIKTNLTAINPILVTGLRLLIACLVFLPFLKLRKLGQENLVAIISDWQPSIWFDVYIL